MNARVLVALTVGLLASCRREAGEQPAPEDPDWVKLEIPGARTAYAIAGDLDRTLLVTTHTKAYRSTDRGRTWQETKNFQGPVFGLARRGDTLFTLQAGGHDVTGQRVAGLVQHFTTDYGRTWHANQQYYRWRDYRQPIGCAAVTGGPAYEIRQNFAPTPTGYSPRYFDPSELLCTENGARRILRLPAARVLENLHLDAQHRLYVGAASCAHRTAYSSGDCTTGTDAPAVVYVSRRPLP